MDAKSEDEGRGRDPGTRRRTAADLDAHATRRRPVKFHVLAIAYGRLPTTDARGEAVPATLASPLTSTSQSPPHTLQTENMEEFKEEEIESILYIGREVSGQPAVRRTLQARSDSSRAAQCSRSHL